VTESSPRLVPPGWFHSRFYFDRDLLVPETWT